jgi:hypothetical protein
VDVFFSYNIKQLLEQYQKLVKLIKFLSQVGSPLKRITLLQQTQLIRGVNNENFFQITKNIYKEEKLRGFFRGNTSDIMRSVLLL